MRCYLSTLQSYGLKPPRRMRICYMVLWLPDKSLKLNCIENVNTLTPRRKPSERPEKNLTFELLKILPKNFVLNKIGFIFAGVRTLYLFNLKPTPFLFWKPPIFPYTPASVKPQTAIRPPIVHGTASLAAEILRCLLGVGETYVSIIGPGAWRCLRKDWTRFIRAFLCMNGFWYHAMKNSLSLKHKSIIL